MVVTTADTFHTRFCCCRLRWPQYRCRPRLPNTNQAILNPIRTNQTNLLLASDTENFKKQPGKPASTLGVAGQGQLMGEM